ncbi:MAG: hypothetical protein ACLP3C_29665 [Mycobacterium sp.]|uniref:hypothetical protein n=1 Tax=Mycobacterium sp. TaxID=1785 RepID=UPI003F99E9E1
MSEPPENTPNWRNLALQLTPGQRRRLFLLECELKVRGWDDEDIREMLYHSAQQWAAGRG